MNSLNVFLGVLFAVLVGALIPLSMVMVAWIGFDILRDTKDTTMAPRMRHTGRVLATFMFFVAALLFVGGALVATKWLGTL